MREKRPFGRLRAAMIDVSSFIETMHAIYQCVKFVGRSIKKLFQEGGLKYEKKGNYRHNYEKLLWAVCFGVVIFAWVVFLRRACLVGYWLRLGTLLYFSIVSNSVEVHFSGSISFCRSAFASEMRFNLARSGQPGHSWEPKRSHMLLWWHATWDCRQRCSPAGALLHLDGVKMPRKAHDEAKQTP